MRLLILTQYFLPEIGPPQNRLSELAVRLQALGHHVEVLTGMPNYPHMKIHEEYRGKLSMRETLRGLTVHRSWIYVSQDKSSLVKRMLNYCSFMFTSFFRGLFIRGKWDYILCESPPLFLGITGVLLSRIKGAKFIFNVSDLWPKSAESLGLVTNRSALRLSYRLEEWIYQNSFAITCQTQGISKDIVERHAHPRTHWLPNSVDTALFDPEKVTTKWREKMNFEEDQFLVFYGGILGHAQGLEVMLNAAKKLEGTRALFVFLGDGPRKEALEKMAEELELENVRFLPSVPRTAMPEVIAGIDALVAPLKKLPIFKGALPSKVFENLAMEKPVFLGVDGEARELFINQANAGWYYEPENSDVLAEAIADALKSPEKVRQFGQNGRRFVIEHFERKSIVERFENFLKSTES